MKKLILLALLIGQIFALENIEANRENILKLQQQHIPIVDIRLPGEWENTGTIPNAYKVTFFTFSGSVHKNFYTFLKKHNINKNTKFAIICRTGHRTKIASELIAKHGYKNVINLKGGMFSLFRSMLKECLNGTK